MSEIKKNIFRGLAAVAIVGVVYLFGMKIRANAEVPHRDHLAAIFNEEFPESFELLTWDEKDSFWRIDFKAELTEFEQYLSKSRYRGLEIRTVPVKLNHFDESKELEIKIRIQKEEVHVEMLERQK